jgi:hypothetical protein
MREAEASCFRPGKLGHSNAVPLQNCGAREVTCSCEDGERAVGMLDAVEGALDFFYGIAEDYRAAVGAAHGAVGFCQGA